MLLFWLFVYVVLLCGSIYFLNHRNDIISSLSTFILLIPGFMLILHPILYSSTINDYNNYVATCETIKRARNNKELSEFELATLQREVIEVNKLVANTLYWSKFPYFNSFYCKKIKTIEYIK